MASSLRPRLVSLEAFSGALLVALGLAPLGCAGDVITEEGSGGSGGSSGTTPPSGPTGPTGSGGGSTSSGSGPGSTSTGETSVSVGTTGPSGSTAVSTGAGGSGGGSGGCVDPQPIEVDGKDTGIDRCAGGQLRRRASNECPEIPPGDETCCGACPEGTFCSTQGEVACSCVEKCSTDADCAEGSICYCGSPAGWCVPAGCATGDDCAGGEECTSWDPTLGCMYLQFACTTPSDECGGDLDCNGQLCAVDVDGVRRCVDGGCAIGRPFLVEGEARTAPVVPRGDWLDAATAVRPIDDETEREEVAAAWERTARMEHASIAAFARFSLQLLALGAPAELLERTNQALADETRHARLAFAITSAYRGRPVGPGALALDGALASGDDVATFVRLLVREGCVGETVASLEAAECEASAEDPAIRQVLATIAADEAAHAELAWRTARWAVDALGPAARLAVSAELAHVEGELAATNAVDDRSEAALLRHGIAGGATRARFRREALRRAIVPCLRALVAAPSAPVASAAQAASLA